MKEFELYQCEVCGTIYTDKLKAKKCEKHHAAYIEPMEKEVEELAELKRTLKKLSGV
nr:MAG TPA: Rubredoxin evolution, hydrogenase, nickel, energy.86A [Caudoviricetes sp.]